MLKDLSVINKNIMINGLYNYLVKSNDACGTLSPLSLPVFQSYQNHLCRVDSLNLFLLSSSAWSTVDQLHISTDGGNSWVRKMDTTGLLPHVIGFFDSLEGIIVRFPYSLMHTKNAGGTWTDGPSPTSMGASAIQVFGDSTVIVGDALGGFYLSKDRGNTWPISHDIGNPIADIFFLNADNIFVITSQAGNTPDPNTIAKSMNGGQSWQHNGVPLGNPLGVVFRNANEGYVVGSTHYASTPNSTKGMILKTTDGGQTWTFFDPQVNEMLVSIELLNDSIALVSGYNGVLFTWNTKQTLFTALDEQALDHLSISIGPNPAGNNIRLQVPEAQTQSLRFSIQNTLGQTVIKDQALEAEQEVDLRALSSGVYFLKIQNDRGQKTVKFLKD